MHTITKMCCIYYPCVKKNFLFKLSMKVVSAKKFFRDELCTFTVLLSETS